MKQRKLWWLWAFVGAATVLVAAGASLATGVPVGGFLPLVGIGGITRYNAVDVIAAGASAVAVISAVLGAESPEEAAREISGSIETSK